MKRRFAPDTADWEILSGSALDPAFKEINADKIFPLSMEEVQANYKTYLDEFRSYFGE